jgi:hypothetical protein
VQAGAAELIASGLYRLTHLLKVQRGTEGAMGDPAPGRGAGGQHRRQRDPDRVLQRRHGSILVTMLLHWQLNMPMLPAAQTWDMNVFVLLTMLVVRVRRVGMLGRKGVVTEVMPVLRVRSTRQSGRSVRQSSRCPNDGPRRLKASSERSSCGMMIAEGTIDRPDAWMLSDVGC